MACLSRAVATTLTGARELVEAIGTVGRFDSGSLLRETGKPPKTRGAGR
jgi:hypothetical protein